MLMVTKAFVLVAAVLSAAGWLLSGLQQLNRAGYAGVFGVVAVAAWLGMRRKPRRAPPRPWLRRRARRLCWRARRPLPLLFFALALAGLVGGALYAPVNADAVIYRIPRMMQWITAEHWHWIHTRDPRQNIVCPGMEWLSLPWLLFTRSDRGLFLVNAFAYLLLPGLVYSVFLRLGVRPRVAWHWMWVLPGGWCYAMQAGSAANDSFAAVYVLAALALAFRARERQSAGDLCLSLLAAALLTGGKQTNVPLVLPWLLVAAPRWRLLAARPVLAGATGLGALVISMLPQTIFNLSFAGTWTGFPAERDFQPESALVGIVGNAFALTAQNLVPPFFPWFTAWNTMMTGFLETPLGAHFRSFEGFGYLFRGVNEQTAGFGMVPSLLVLLSCGAAWRLRRGVQEARPKRGWPLRLLQWTPFGLLLVFMAKVGIHQNARYLAPYYLLFFPLWLAGRGHVQLVRRVWWQRAAALMLLCSLVLVVVSRHRPLWPAETITGRLQRLFPGCAVFGQALRAYTFSAELRDPQTLGRELVPPGETVLGYAALGLPEANFWWPYGSRRLLHVLDQDPPEELPKRGFRYLIINDRALARGRYTDVHDWLGPRRLELVKTVRSRFDPELSPERVYLARVAGAAR